MPERKWTLGGELRQITFEVGVNGSCLYILHNQIIIRKQVKSYLIQIENKRKILWSLECVDKTPIMHSSGLEIVCKIEMGAVPIEQEQYIIIKNKNKRHKCNKYA